jgi:anti-sigma regulatory factor (Ser/Thr protein kinase)
VERTEVPTETFRVTSQGNTVKFGGVFKMLNLEAALERVRDIADGARYPTVKFDFSDVVSAYPTAVTALLARIKYYHMNQIDTPIVLPTNNPARGEFRRYGWDALFDPAAFKHARNRFDQFIPTYHYTTSDEQAHSVTCIIKAILLQVPNLDRRQVAATEWALSEITDNVLNHSRSPVGGLVTCHVQRQYKLIEFIVADAGVGIARTLREPDHGIALEKAIQEGVTANIETNQGNGLFGTYRLAVHSKGLFSIRSQRGSLFVRPSGSVKVDSNSFQYPGTCVISQIDISDPQLIAKALTIKGRVHEPAFDYIEQHFEKDEQGVARIVLVDHVSSLGSRESGRRVSTLLNNVLNMADSTRVEIDFKDISIISSSFADECFGRLIASVGPSEFFSRISFVNTDSSVRAIIDRSVLQRLRVSG